MPFSGSAPTKTYQRTDGVRTGTAVCTQADAASVNNTAALADTRENDLATAINALWLRDGGNQPVADLPMNDHKFTGLSAGSARNDSIRLGQVQDGIAHYGEASGTANAIAVTTAPVCSPVEGMVIGFVAEADNTGATTVALNGGSALALQIAGAACIGGEVKNGQFHRIGHDGTQWQLLNPFSNGKISSIAALTPTDNNVIVGNGTTWVAESGATLRTSIGLGTSDSPQFTGIELGNASDTTLTRASAGVLAVEGVNLLRANQNLSDLSSAATAFGNIKQAASDTATGVIEIADQTEMEAASDLTRAVTPGRQRHHPTHPKAWISFNGQGTPSIFVSSGISSITDDAVGQWTLNFTTAFASAGYASASWCRDGAANQAAFLAGLSGGIKTTTAHQTAAFRVGSGGAVLVDSVENNLLWLGDQ